MNSLPLLNAVSVSMLPREWMTPLAPGPSLQAHAAMSFTPLTLDEARSLVQGGVENHIGHADTARIISEQLGVSVAVNRASFRASQQQSRALLAQYSGPRLPEGATTLPEGAAIEYFLVSFGSWFLN